MTLTNGQIVNLYEGLRAARSVVFPIEVTYTLLQDQRNLWEAYKGIFDKQQNIRIKYGIHEYDDTTLSVDDAMKANAEWEELALLKQTVELRPVKLSDFTGAKISMEALDALMPIISGEE